MTMRYLPCYLLLLGLCVACGGTPEQAVAPPPAPDPATVYDPYLSTLTIRSEIDYPTGFKATLYDDRERTELASATTANGHFVLEVPGLATNEVYFLKLEGKRRAFGMDGLAWEERVPLYFSPSGEAVALQGKPYHGAESVSRMRFYVEGGEAQASLNEWQDANNSLVARIENQVSQEASLGGITSSKKRVQRESLRAGIDRIAREAIATDSPNVATLFLVYRRNDHRDKHVAYQDIYARTAPSARQSKYGVDLARRIQKIHAPVEAISIVGDSVLADGRLMPLDTAALGNPDYWLLYFWSSREKASVAGLEALQEALGESEPGRATSIFVSVDEVFSRWRARSQELGLAHSYFIRKESRQDLINALYLTEVPRIVLMRPDGSVLDDDVDLASLPSTLGQATGTQP